MLRDAGFQHVERFTDHFPGGRKKSDPDTAIREKRVLDPKVIKLGSDKKWLIVTTDSNMRFTHVEEIKRNSNAAILATAHNSVTNPIIWVNAIVLAKAAIERIFKKQKTPWVGQFDTRGRITTCYTVEDRHTTRRNRPREQGVAVVARANMEKTV